MSELMTTRNAKKEFRHQLLTTASTLSLLAAIYGSDAKAEQDADRPTIWIELGAQLEHADGQGENFPVGFLAANPDSPVLKPISPLQAQNPPPFSFGEEGKISFQPEDSDWVLSATIRVGRSSNSREVDHQTNKAHYFKYHNGVVPPSGDNLRGIDDFADTHTHHRESHAILDFAAGKDVGLGLFGREGSSVLSLGVRFAQFSSKTTFDVRARPDLQWKYFTNRTVLPSDQILTIPVPRFHTYHATGAASRSFHGIGPSLSWNSSAPFIGNSANGEAALDWGLNAALLFGRQKTRVQHQASGHYVTSQFIANGQYFTAYPAVPGGHASVRSVMVPNLGGFAGLSFRYSDAKFSVGYRADLFFGAIDGGIDARKSENVGFFGPFATISVGIGG